MGPPEVIGLSTSTRLIRQTGRKLFLTGETSIEYLGACTATQLLFDVFNARQGMLNDEIALGATLELVNGGPVEKIRAALY